MSYKLVYFFYLKIWSKITSKIFKRGKKISVFKFGCVHRNDFFKNKILKIKDILITVLVIK